MDRSRRALSAAGCILPLVMASSVRAQSTASAPPAGPLPPARAWTVEVHGGVLRGASPSGGTGQLPPYGGSFQTANDETSPVVSSWYFGDGAVWLGNYAAVISSAAKINPADHALTASALQRQRGPAWGVRVTRQLGRRLDLEFTVDRGQGSSVLSPSAVAALQNATTSFETAWRTLLSSLPSSSASSRLTVSDDVGRQLFATGALDVVFGEHRWVRYVSLGGGLAVNSGTAAATLAGTAGFAIDGQSALQTDAVTVSFAERRLQPVGAIGVGLIYYATPRSGVRLDGRGYIRRNPGRTFVTTAPVTSGTPTVEDLLNPAGNVVQFSGLAGAPSTLSQDVTRVQTFAGAGAYAQLSFTVGYFFRF